MSPNKANSKTFITFLFIVFMLPWPHGGEVVWQYLLICISIFSLAAITLFRYVNKNKENFVPFTNIKFPLVLMGAWIFFQIFQIIPLPIKFSTVTVQSIENLNWQTISVAPNITIVELIKHISYITFFILTILLVNTKARVLVLANTLFFSSTIIAIYSLINHYTSGLIDLVSSIPPWTLSWERATHGTFSYQNHYASFLTLTIPLGFGLIYHGVIDIKKQIKNNSKRKITIDLIMSINGLYLLSLIIMYIALVESSSRGGNVIFVISILIAYFSVLFQQTKRTTKKIKHASFVLLGTSIICFIAVTSGITGTLSDRLLSQGFKPSGRDVMHQTAIRIIKKRPIVGTGAGTYPVLQHKYKSPLLGASKMSKRAHNDYLEMLSNQGIMGFGLLAIATGILYFKLFRGLRKNLNKNIRSLYGLQIACFCSVTAILLHSLADFNFHLPANTVYYNLILAMGLQIYCLNARSLKKDSRKVIYP